MSGVRNNVERRARYRRSQPAANRQREKRIVFSPDHRGGATDLSEPCTERLRLARVQRGEMSEKCRLSLFAVEGSLILVDRVYGAVRCVIPTLEISAHNWHEPVCGYAPNQRHERAGDADVPGWPAAERHRVDECEAGHAGRRVHREGLSHPSTELVANDACGLNSERVQKADYTRCVRAERQRRAARRVAATVAEQVDDDESMPRGHLRDDLTPQMPRRREAMQKYHWLSDATCSGSIVVKATAENIDELTAHECASERESGRTALAQDGAATLSVATPW